ncbi:MAG TPA: tetrahydrofolate dehydrogenase/cyclohydrolase catalytic domain-containing protein [Longimicrobiales bacterium]
MPLIMDGTGLARRRASGLAARAAAVRARRGEPPRLLLLAFAGPGGRVPHIERKLRACAAAGVETVPLLLPPDTSSSAAIASLHARLERTRVDGVFLQFPFPAAIDGDALAASVPGAVDVDIMTPGRTAAYLEGTSPYPPVTVSAGLLLLEEYGIDIDGVSGVVVAEESPFAVMFREALNRRGAAMAPLLPPDARDRDEALAAARLVVAAAAQPGSIPAKTLGKGAVAIDVGYFNPGGRGDIDVSGGIAHLRALAPVPGGIGPMTVSALIERVVEFAEKA